MSPEIIPFDPARHGAAFRDLNLAWIEQYFRIEPFDLEELNHPVEAVLEPGGAIWVAEINHEPVGVCALLAFADRFEVSKMAIREDLQGQGIGRRLLTAVIEHAEQLGAPKLLIISNTVLAPAIHLYRSLGFKEIPMPEGQPYDRGNIALERYFD